MTGDRSISEQRILHGGAPEVVFVFPFVLVGSTVTFVTGVVVIGVTVSALIVVSIMSRLMAPVIFPL